MASDRDTLGHSGARKPSWAWSSVDDPDPHYPKCDRCEAFARWSIARAEGTFDIRGDLEFITRWFACGTHLNRILIDEEWELDVVHIYDLTRPSERA